VKPRVASYYEHRLGRNDGNPLYVTHVLKRDYAEALDYDHLVPDPAAHHDVMGRYDLHLWIDWAEDALARGGLLPYEVIPCPRPSFYWVSDVHLGYAYRLEKAKAFDWIGVAQRDYVDRFRAEGVTGEVLWLPHAVEPDAYNPGGVYARTAALRTQVGAMRATFAQIRREGGIHGVEAGIATVGLTASGSFINFVMTPLSILEVFKSPPFFPAPWQAPHIFF